MFGQEATIKVNIYMVYQTNQNEINKKKIYRFFRIYSITI